MLVFLDPTVISEFPNSLGNCRVIRDDGAAIAASSEIFYRIKTEAGGIAHRSSAAALVTSAVGLGGIFDNAKIVAPGDFKDRIHVCRLSVQMYRDDGSRF